MTHEVAIGMLQIIAREQTDPKWIEAFGMAEAALRAQGEPSPGLLMSMALRSDHALGLPGYYDLHGPGMHAKKLAHALREMRQLWEEVTGNGFYSAAREAEYAALAEQQTGKEQ